MDIVTIDFETFWSATHSLSKMPPTEYVMHPETQIISAAVKVNDRKTAVYFGEDRIRAEFKRIDWGNALVVGHNMSEFDSMICAWRFGIKPKLWGCTMAMARPYHAKTCGLSLGALVEHYGIGVKDNRVLKETQGKKLEDFTADELFRMEKYNKDDTDQCHALFGILKGKTSAFEMMQIHMTVQMLVAPQFELDRALVESTLDQVRVEKKRTLLNIAQLLRVEERIPATVGGDQAVEDATIELTRAELASAPKFAQLLVQLGVGVPMKESKTAKNADGSAKMIPALAKTDEEFIALQEHDDPIVAAAAAARLDVKSTILETRLEAFLRAGAACGGMLPIPIKYYGADTTGRWSGQQYNPQNLPRIGKKPKPSDALRMSLCAPKGHKVIVADLSGIELRVNHTLWQVAYSMKLWKDKADADLYRAAGAIEYLCEPDAITTEQRQLEKVKALGLGFGAGYITFMSVAKTMGGVILTPEQSDTAVRAWRSKHRNIVQGWEECQSALLSIEAGYERPIDPWGLCCTSREGIVLPSGRVIRYPNLRLLVDEETGKKQWVYGDGRHKTYIYGGKVDENVVQALARDVIAGNALDFYRKTRRTPALMVHDELVYVVPEKEAEDLLNLLQQIMRTPPSWWPELVTWSEGDAADRYGEAK